MPGGGRRSHRLPAWSGAAGPEHRRERAHREPRGPGRAGDDERRDAARGGWRVRRARGELHRLPHRHPAPRAGVPRARAAAQGCLPGVHRPGRVRARPAGMAGRGHRGGGQAMTFSLAGRCERTGAVGAVIASASMAVAARCAAVRAGVGAVCSQSTSDPRLREALLEAMAGGLAASDALAAVVGHTPDIAYRQLAVVDAAGSLLADPGVPAAMLAAFGDRAGQSLGERLIAALQAGLAAGGEVSPVRSAGLVIAESVPWPVTDLRVDWHDDPVGQLAGLWQLWQPQVDSYVRRALHPS